MYNSEVLIFTNDSKALVFAQLKPDRIIRCGLGENIEVLGLKAAP
jgi:hypothetical protein